AWACLMRSEYRRRRGEIAYSVLSNLVVAAGVAGVLGVGGREVMDGRLTIGGLVAFYSYLARLFEPLYLAIEMNSRFQRISASVHRIRMFLSTRPSVDEDPRPVHLPKRSLRWVAGHVAMEEVSFRYQAERRLLDAFSLDISPGERTALVGASGS